MSQNSSIRTDLKILVIGCSGAGKTSFVQRWINGGFEKYYKPTIVSEFQYKIFECRGNCYRIQLWDIGGQDKSPSIGKIFARDSLGCLVISDCSKPESLKDSLDWKKVMSDESVFVDGQKIPFVLIQNKIDLIEEKNELEEIENKTKIAVEENDFIKYYMSSVKENVNVDEVMDFIIGNIVDRLEVYTKNGGEFFLDDKRQKSFSLKEKPLIKDEKSSCC